METATITDLQELCGKSLDSLPAPLLAGSSVKSFPDATFRFVLARGISFEFSESNVLRSVHCYSGVEKPFARYKGGGLPAGLTLGLKGWAVVGRYGDTSKKGGGKIPVWLEYPHLGFQLSFQGSSWEDQNNVIVSMCIFIPEGNVKDFRRGAAKECFGVRECSVCLKPIKEAKVFCPSCKLVFYCSEECRSQHAKSHGKLCVGGAV